MTRTKKGTQPLGMERKLWQAADKLRGNLDPSEYKHVVLGLVFLKYISDTFEKHRSFLQRAVGDPESDYYLEDEDARELIIESRDEYTAENVFWVPKEARWSNIQDRAKQADVGKTVDSAMDLIERENPQLRGVLPKNYSRPALDKRRLGELIDLIGSVGLAEEDHAPRDLLGRVYEYFLSQFAGTEGKGGGEFYTPSTVVQLLVEMLEPFEGRVYDPCCGSGGMFVQSIRFVEAHGGRKNDLSVYGQELNFATWRLAKMNLAIRGIESNLGDEPADTFHKDKHPDLRADYILANPPFNISDWGGDQLTGDRRWKHGQPPASNANFAWLQHIVFHLAPGGVAGVVLANGSMSTQRLGEDEIRRQLIEADLVDCMVALPPQLFYSTQIPACLWFLARDRGNGQLRDRRGEILFIDARDMGDMVSRTDRILTDEDITKISNTYHAWRGEDSAGEYADVPGFCRAVPLDEIAEHGHQLTPARYVGAADLDDDDEPFNDKVTRLSGELEELFRESRGLQDEILDSLAGVSDDIG